MKIGIVGTGNMGRTLGLAWAEHGHEVFFGARDAAQARAAAALARGGARHGGNDEAAAFGEVVFWSVRAVPVREVLASPASLEGKVLIDPNNGPPPTGVEPGPRGDAPSLAERLAADAPRARVVKAFNTIPQEVFELSPEALRSHGASVFLAGDDPAATRVVADLAAQLGFAPVDAGPLGAARMLEDVARFLVYLIVREGRSPYTTLSLRTLPEAARPRFGGREPSRMP